MFRRREAHSGIITLVLLNGMKETADLSCVAHAATRAKAEAVRRVLTEPDGL